jgi:malonate decarboxylase delta subunit
METFTIKLTAEHRLEGERKSGIVGVVASGNLEALFERTLPGNDVEVEISTPITGFGEIWRLVVADVVKRTSPGGMRVSINDGGARPDVVTLRLLQGVALMEEP